jgi:8-oxo-dGTP diphosphatase
MRKRVIRVVAAVIERGGCYLITQRKEAAVLPLLWEFPGGRVEPDETDIDALMREVRHRVGVEVRVEDKLGEHLHEYDAYDVHLSLFACALPEGVEARAVSVKEVRWVASGDLDDYQFPPADQSTMSKLLGLTN